MHVHHKFLMKYTFWKLIGKSGMYTQPQVHFVCSSCYDNLPNDSCQHCPTCHNPVSRCLSFTTLSIESQLAPMFKCEYCKNTNFDSNISYTYHNYLPHVGRGFFEALQHCFRRVKADSSSIEDIYDDVHTSSNQ